MPVEFPVLPVHKPGYFVDNRMSGFLPRLSKAEDPDVCYVNFSVLHYASKRERQGEHSEFLGEEGSSRIYKLRAREMNLFKPEGAGNSGFLSNQTRLPRWQP